MLFLYAILVLVIFTGSLAIIYVSYYNKMQYIRTKIEQSESIIDEALREKYDFILAARDCISSVLKSDKDYFKNLDQLKNKKISNFDLDRTLNEKMRIVMQLFNDHEKIDHHAELKSICKKIKAVDEKLSAAKGYYNKYTAEENQYVRSFPSNFVAKMHGMRVSPFFDGKDMTDDIVDDFKL